MPCIYTGLSYKFMKKVDPYYLDANGNLDVSLFPDCNRWNVSSLSAELRGVSTNSRELAAIMRRDPAYPWRIVPDWSGTPAIWCTHVSSGDAWFTAHTTAMHARQIEHLRRGPALTEFHRLR